MAPARRNQYNNRSVPQERVALILRDDREEDYRLHDVRASSRTNHQQVLRTVYITFSDSNHLPVTHSHISEHFQSYYPDVSVQKIKVQTPTPNIPNPLCAWVVFESNEDMVGVLGPELLPVEDVTDLNQTMWIRPQTCLCDLCKPPAPEDYD